MPWNYFKISHWGEKSQWAEEKNVDRSTDK